MKLLLSENKFSFCFIINTHYVVCINVTMKKCCFGNVYTHTLFSNDCLMRQMKLKFWSGIFTYHKHFVSTIRLPWQYVCSFMRKCPLDLIPIRFFHIFHVANRIFRVKQIDCLFVFTFCAVRIPAICILCNVDRCKRVSTSFPISISLNKKSRYIFMFLLNYSSRKWLQI